MLFLYEYIMKVFLTDKQGIEFLAGLISLADKLYRIGNFKLKPELFSMIHRNCCGGFCD